MKGNVPRVLFLDAEGTLWYPRPGHSAADFWDRPTPQRALEVFQVEPGVVEWLRALRSQGVRLVVVSKHIEPLLHLLIEAFGFGGLFHDVLVTGEKAGAIQAYLERHRVPRSQALMVGDSPEMDVEPVRAVGVPALHLDRRNEWRVGARISHLGSLAAWFA